MWVTRTWPNPAEKRESQLEAVLLVQSPSPLLRTRRPQLSAQPLASRGCCTHGPGAFFVILLLAFAAGLLVFINMTLIF